MNLEKSMSSHTSVRLCRPVFSPQTVTIPQQRTREKSHSLSKSITAGGGCEEGDVLDERRARTFTKMSGNKGAGRRGAQTHKLIRTSCDPPGLRLHHEVLVKNI